MFRSTESNAAVMCERKQPCFSAVIDLFQFVNEP